jgi:hypothetical protein
MEHSRFKKTVRKVEGGISALKDESNRKRKGGLSSPGGKATRGNVICSRPHGRRSGRDPQHVALPSARGRKPAFNTESCKKD